MSGVIWITGLSGAGKTSLAELVIAELRARGEPAVLLDGDALRAALGAAGHAYGCDERRRLAWQYARLAQLLAAQRVTVVAAVMALFDEVRAFHRTQPVRYLEVWLRAPELLRSRRARDEREGGGPRVGREIAPELPRAAHLVLDNDDSPATLPALAARVLAAWDDHGGD